VQIRIGPALLLRGEASRAGRAPQSALTSDEIVPADHARRVERHSDAWRYAT
jgi:hypothetical protein